jgi:hypothetical protein
MFERRINPIPGFARDFRDCTRAADREYAMTTMLRRKVKKYRR